MPKRYRSIDFNLENWDKENWNPAISVSEVLYKHNREIRFKVPKTDHSKCLISFGENRAIYLWKYKEDRESLAPHSREILNLEGLVFTAHDYKPIDRSILTHAFAGRKRQAKLVDVHFRALCHNWARLMLLKGVNSLVISQSLGHASVAFTLQTYCHIMNSMKRDAAKLY